MAEKPILQLFDKIEDNFLNRVLHHLSDSCSLINNEKVFVFWNKAAEELTGLKADEILGKSCQSESKLFYDGNGLSLCGGSCPGEQAMKDGLPRIVEVYVRHKNGFRIPVNLRLIPILNSSGQAIGLTEIFTNITPSVTIPFRVNELEKMQLLDLDTGIPNRLYMEMYLKNKIDEYQKYNLSFGLIYADVDNFNKIQERFGRFNAAKLVRMIARTLHKNIRYFDVVARWDNEEFLIGLLNIDENRLDIVANKLRLLVAESYINVETGLLNATVSMGATLVQRFDTVESLVKRAEQLMLHSKWRGRNKVSLGFTQKET
ncbi:MAG: diguanylate cyclase [Candidatus Saccharicenans sp.]|nr:MAG: sensor domain-containing diguanylate cyclase [Candidatus Aminicenantes bacterium]